MDLDKINAELKRLSALLPRGGSIALARELGFHRNTVSSILEGNNLNLTENVQTVHSGLRKYLRDRIDTLIHEADSLHQALKPREIKSPQYDSTEA